MRNDTWVLLGSAFIVSILFVYSTAIIQLSGSRRTNGNCSLQNLSHQGNWSCGESTGYVWKEVKMDDDETYIVFVGMVVIMLFCFLMGMWY